jgi:transposase InsO family protein
MMQREGFAVGEACDWSRVSRAGFYRAFSDHAPRQADTVVRDLIQKLALENRMYGYRRIRAELDKLGYVVNGKRIRRLMREDNLLVVRKRKSIFTTDSRHTYAVYPNLAATRTVTRTNQLWVADITYVHLRETFLYLAVILDAHSRRVVGWHLDNTLKSELVLKALERALEGRSIEPGIVHHSDRGTQYCSGEYVARLERLGFLISMSRAGNPYDNAKAESFMKTLKTEEVYLQRYRDAEHALTSIGTFIEQVYNAKRLHSSLGYLSPCEFEARANGELRA